MKTTRITYHACGVRVCLARFRQRDGDIKVDLALILCQVTLLDYKGAVIMRDA